MKTKTYNVYTFAELSAAAKQRAKNKHAEIFGYSWADEALDSLKALAVHFGGKLSRYEIDWFNGSRSSASFAMPADVYGGDEIAAMLAALGSFDPVTLKGHGHCKLTGYCADESAIDGFRKAWHDGERSLDALMQAAFETWLADAQADCAAQYEDDQFAETSEANGWEYDENGNLD